MILGTKRGKRAAAMTRPIPPGCDPLTEAACDAPELDLDRCTAGCPRHDAAVYAERWSEHRADRSYRGDR